MITLHEYNSPTALRINFWLTCDRCGWRHDAYLDFEDMRAASLDEVRAEMVAIGLEHKQSHRPRLLTPRYVYGIGLACVALGFLAAVSFRW